MQRMVSARCWQVSLFFYALASSLWAQPVVRVGSAEYPPLVMRSPAGEADGLGIAILELIAQDEGWILDHHVGTRAEGIERLLRGEIDLWIGSPDPLAHAGLEYNQEAYLSDRGEVFVSRERPVARPEDLVGLRIAALNHDWSLEGLRALEAASGQPFEIVIYDSPSEVFEAMAKGEADALGISHLLGHRSAKDFDLRETGIIFAPHGAYFVFREGESRALIDAIDNRLRIYKSHPESAYHNLFDQWLDGSTEELFANHIIWILWTLLILAILVLVSIGLIYLLRGQVRQKTAQLSQRAEELQHEIEDRKRAEKALSESEYLFRTLFNLANSGIVVVDNEERYVQVNQKWGEMLGYDPEELLGRSPFEFTHPDDIDHTRHQFRQTIDDTIPAYQLQKRYVRRDGSVIWCDISVTRLEDTNHPAQRIMGILTDITELKKAETAVRESEEKYRLLAETANDIILTHDMEGTITYANNVTEKILGYRKEEIIGRNILEFFPPEEQAKALERYQERSHGDKSLNTYDATINHKDGASVVLEIQSTPMLKDDQTVAIMIIGRNITKKRKEEEERRRLEIQIQHAQKLESLGVLAGGIAHDFNNLLMGILGNASMALMDLSPISPVRASIQHIEQAAQRAADLTKQMLAYSGKGTFVIMPVDLSDLVQEMLYLLEVSISKKAALRFNLTRNLPAVEADPTQIRQIIMNLITNASEAIGEETGTIQVNTGLMECENGYLESTYFSDELPEGPYVFLEVSDNGCGMDKETVGRIFDPFFTTKFTGRGLGLAAVLGIVRSHHGALKVYSEPGQGTTFKILFPASKAPAVSEIPPTPSNVNWRGKGKVLVIDDEPAVRDLAQTILDRSGFEVLSACDGLEGIEVFRQHAVGITLVLLDMTMPRMGGEETFRELKRIDPEVRVILSSGYSEQKATERFAGKGLAGFIQKPYRPMELIHCIRGILQPD